jgi:1,4-dihydroxy-6-naphthoate synthase
MSVLLGLGFSPCPNDTFMFHGLVARDVEVPGVRFVAELDDIEVLNRRALGDDPRGPLAVTKISASAVGQLTDRYTVLAAGAALGRGVGPLVVRRAADVRTGALDDLAGLRVAIPGERTTAALLLRLFAPAAIERVPMRFDRIMDALAAGECDAGVVIHESRFTYRDHGLALVADLGEVWEAATGLPLPLGVIAASRQLPRGMTDLVEDGLRRSIELARREPARSRAYVRAHAQELSDEVCDMHVALYVNDFSVDLGEEGRAAIDELLARARAVGALPAGARAPWR